MNLNPSDVIKRPRFLTSPRRPGYDIEFHPRANNKPLDCQVGKHPILRRIIGPGGIPHLYCPKCGSSVAEGLHTGTWSKDDIQRLTKIKQGMYSAEKYGKPKTKKELMEEAWRKHQENRSQRRERMGASIEKFVHDRMLDQ
jgi:hypothetical protein